MNTISHDAGLGGLDRAGAPTLRVMAADSRDHRATWLVGGRAVVEQVWTDTEWAALTEAERPGRAQRLGGIGWSVLTFVDEDGPGSA